MKVSVSAKAGLVRAAIWLVASVLFLDIALGKVRDLHETGGMVSPWRYVQVVFWALMLVFWIWQAWQGWQTYRTGRRVS